MGKNAVDLGTEVGIGPGVSMGSIHASLVDKSLLKPKEEMRFSLQQVVKEEEQGDGQTSSQGSKRLRAKNLRETMQGAAPWRGIGSPK